MGAIKEEAEEGPAADDDEVDAIVVTCCSSPSATSLGSGPGAGVGAAFILQQVSRGSSGSNGVEAVVEHLSWDSGTARANSRRAVGSDFSSTMLPSSLLPSYQQQQIRRHDPNYTSQQWYAYGQEVREYIDGKERLSGGELLPRIERY